MKTCTIHNERPTNSEHAFAVMLLPVPSLPDGAEPYPKMTMRAIIGASDHGLTAGTFGWTHLTTEEKDVIGDALHASGAEENRWYWCELWEQDDSVLAA